jgi:hypothetical protein
MTALVAAGALLLTACASTSTKIMGSWKDDHYAGKITKVLVISLAEEPPIRQKAESIVVAKLRRRGVDAVASNTLMPMDEKIDRETVKAAIAGKGFDSVLVTRLLGVNLNTGYVPPEQTTVYNLTVTVSPGYTVHRPVVSTRVDLYDTANEHLIWSMTTQSSNHDTVADVVNAYSSVMVKAMAKQGLI